MKSAAAFRTWSIAFMSLAALLAASCGSVEPSPTGPSPLSGVSEPAPTPAPAPTPTPEPAPTPDPAPSGPGRLEVTINPNPVPWSGQPIDASGCASVPNTWFYDQVLENTGGMTLTVNDRADSFNGREVLKRSNLGIVLEPGAETSIRTRWCSASAGPHTAQTNFSGQDANGNAVSLTGPLVHLNAK